MAEVLADSQKPRPDAQEQRTDVRELCPKRADAQEGRADALAECADEDN